MRMACANPVGMDWQPGTNVLWTAVNERDELGDELVPDYLTSVKQGAFYGWPYSYFGHNPDPRRKGERDDLVKAAVVPDVPLGAHTASLGLAFYNKTAFPAKYRNGAFIGQHGSWKPVNLCRLQSGICSICQWQARQAGRFFNRLYCR